MKTYDEMTYHPQSEQLAQMLCNYTQNKEPTFFRVLVAYYWGMAASMMRAKVVSPAFGGEIPVNTYAFNFAPSGMGKGKSMNLMEDKIIDQFRYNFMQYTFPESMEKNAAKLALTRAARKQSDPDTEYEILKGEFDSLGPLLFSFDSGTAPAIKDVRHKLLIADAGALNMQIDEIGLNLSQVSEALAPYLELYDVGKIKQKLTKNTSENKRREEIYGRTPANLMAFGEPTSLFNGAATEENFIKLLGTGYARRSLFGYSPTQSSTLELTVEEIWEQRVASNSNSFMDDLSDTLGQLADIGYLDCKIQMNKDVEQICIEYEKNNKTLANEMPEHELMLASELQNRHMKAIKLAGAYAFLEAANEITESHVYSAIKVVEDSGKALRALLQREPPYIKLAKHIADVKRPVTQADLTSTLPYYKGAASVKSEMLKLAIAYGYQNNIIIKQSFTDGVEFVSGESLEKTDLSSMLVSYSTDIAQGYMTERAAFDELHKMTQAQGIHWCNHGFIDGHRTEDAAEPGFNLLVLDVDGGINLSTAKLLLKDYKALFYTTKRHEDGTNERFRIILPMNYFLKLDKQEYKEFWESIYKWLPFEVDHASSQRARKWLSNDGHYEYQDGAIVDVLPFIPKTSKNEVFKSTITDQQGLDNLERWMLNNTGDGNRNKMLLRYALVLVDAGFSSTNVREKILDLNNKMPMKLSELEITKTIMVTVDKQIAKAA